MLDAALGAQISVRSYGCLPLIRQQLLVSTTAILILLGTREAIAASPLNAQKILDYISNFQIPSAPVHPGAPYVPSGSFNSWTETDKAAVPVRVRTSCLLIWTFAHDAPATRFLPLSLSDADEGGVGVELCLAGHMPKDWPYREKTIQAAKTILDRAQQAGSTLQLPSGLEP